MVNHFCYRMPRVCLLHSRNNNTKKWSILCAPKIVLFYYFEDKIYEYSNRKLWWHTHARLHIQSGFALVTVAATAITSGIHLPDCLSVCIRLKVLFRKMRANQTVNTKHKSEHLQCNSKEKVESFEASLPFLHYDFPAHLIVLRCFCYK